MVIAIKKQQDGSIYTDKEIRSNINYEALGFILINIDDKYADCEDPDFNEDFTFNIEKYNARKQSYLYEEQLNELETWFNWYDNQVAQYNRCQRLGIEFDKDINELDNQAKVNQERIAELRIALSITI